MSKLLKDSRVITALVALAGAVAAYLGVDLPQNELTAFISAGDWSGVLSLVLGVVIGALGGYGAAQAKGKPDADSAD
jgi:hypothetical protein